MQAMRGRVELPSDDDGGGAGLLRESRGGVRGDGVDGDDPRVGGGARSVVLRGEDDVQAGEAIEAARDGAEVIGTIVLPVEGPRDAARGLDLDVTEAKGRSGELDGRLLQLRRVILGRGPIDVDAVEADLLADGVGDQKHAALGGGKGGMRQ